MMIQTGTAQAYKHIIDDGQEEGENLLHKFVTIDVAVMEVEYEISTATDNRDAKAQVKFSHICFLKAATVNDVVTTNAARPGGW